MTFKTALTWLAATAATFLVCCFVMLWLGTHMNNPAIIYPFVTLWGLSALIWPLFAVFAFRARNDR